jgi:drug/metabolite transporter, DME family
MNNDKKYYWAILVAAFCFGLIPIFGQLLTNNFVSSFKQTFFMEIFAFIFLVPFYFLVLKGKIIKLKSIPFFIFFGVSLFFVNLLPLTAIALKMPVALVSLLIYIYPAFTLILSRIWFGDEITIKKVFYVTISLIGVVLILGQGLSSGSVTPIGVFIALLGGISLAFWACFGRASSLRGFSPFDSLFWSEVGAVILLIISAFIYPHVFSDPAIGAFNFVFSTPVFFLLVAMSIICVVIGHTLFFYGVEKVKPLQASVLALLEPLTAVVLSAILFSQTLSLWTLVGGILIFASSFLINSGV